MWGWWGAQLTLLTNAGQWTMGTQQLFLFATFRQPVRISATVTPQQILGPKILYSRLDLEELAATTNLYFDYGSAFLKNW